MGPEKNTACGTTARMEKHIALQAQFKHVKNVADELQALLSKIRGEDIDPPSLVSQSDAKVAQIRPEPCLSDVLTMGTDELQEQCNRMRDQIRSLHDILF